MYAFWEAIDEMGDKRRHDAKRWNHGNHLNPPAIMVTCQALASIGEPAGVYLILVTRRLVAILRRPSFPLSY
jgi:hypothetical protein